MPRDPRKGWVLRQSIEEARATPAGSVAGFLPWVLVPAVIIVIDQLLKVLFVAWIGPGAGDHRVELIGNWLAFEYVENTGAAFGMLPTATGGLAIASLVIATGGLFMMWREHRREPLAALAIGLVVGGAIGNVIDRLFRGLVVDFVAVGEFPRFNLADSAITVGVLVLFIAMARENRAHRAAHEKEGVSRADE